MVDKNGRPTDEVNVYLLLLSKYQSIGICLCPISGSWNASPHWSDLKMIRHVKTNFHLARYVRRVQLVAWLSG